MADGSFLNVLLALAGVVGPLLIAWWLIDRGARHRRRRKVRDPRD